MGIFHSKNKIKFQAYNDVFENVECGPICASQSMPDWYKKLPRYVNNSDEPIKSLGSKDLKMCVPFRDAMISGYVIRLAADVEVQIDTKGDVDVFINPLFPSFVVHKRGELNEFHQGNGMPNPLGTVPIMFAWAAAWGAHTDKRFSILYTHPFNRNDLPFVTTSGIVDSGYDGYAGNIPFFIKEGFTGIIPKGTPIAQLLPFRREDWVSEQKPADSNEYNSFMHKRDSYIEGFYARFLRQPRSFK